MTRKVQKFSEIHTSIILDGALRGLNAREISLLVTEKTGQKISQSHISKILADKREEWLKSSQKNTQYYIEQELDHLRMLEREAWRQYEFCGGIIKRETIDEIFDEQDNIKSRKVKTVTTDDPKQALMWFDRVMQIREKRRKILRLEHAITVNANIMAVKAYAGGWSPDKWPAPPAVSDGEDVIEGQSIDEQGLQENSTE